MDMKVYEKTRYQNIYRHKKNKNYVIMMSKPVKTSISRVDNKKIFSSDEAIKVRDNVLLKRQKGLETIHKEDFDTLWDKYIYDCKYVRKLAYGTINKKVKAYNHFFKDKIDKPLTKTDANFWTKFIDNLNTTDKQKNQSIKELKAFFNWCKLEEYIIDNPFEKISKYKVNKTEMKFWLPQQLKQFLNTIEEDINSPILRVAYKAHKIKIFTIIEFSLGNRVGETRALTFNCFDNDKLTVDIRHSINYDPNRNDFLSNTKNYESERTIDVSKKVFDNLIEYRHFLELKMNYDVKNDSLIIFNYKLNRPYSDTCLRNDFYYYCDKANVPKIRMYDLRHTYAATMMYEGKEAYLFSKRMGHKNINTTINVYGHLSNKIRKEIAQSTDKYL